MKRSNKDISQPMEDMDDEEATEYILNTTEEYYYICMFGIDYKNDKKYLQLINKNIKLFFYLRK